MSDSSPGLNGVEGGRSTYRQWRKEDGEERSGLEHPPNLYMQADIQSKIWCCEENMCRGVGASNLGAS